MESCGDDGIAQALQPAGRIGFLGEVVADDVDKQHDGQVLGDEVRGEAAGAGLLVDPGQQVWEHPRTLGMGREMDHRRKSIEQQFAGAPTEGEAAADQMGGHRLVEGADLRAGAARGPEEGRGRLHGAAR